MNSTLVGQRLRLSFKMSVPVPPAKWRGAAALTTRPRRSAFAPIVTGRCTLKVK